MTGVELCVNFTIQNLNEVIKLVKPYFTKKLNAIVLAH